MTVIDIVIALGIVGVAAILVAAALLRLALNISGVGENDL